MAQDNDFETNPIGTHQTLEAAKIYIAMLENPKIADQSIAIARENYKRNLKRLNRIKGEMRCQQSLSSRSTTTNTIQP